MNLFIYLIITISIPDAAKIRSVMGLNTTL